MSDLTERFRHAQQLPPDYGMGMDERCIEYPWMIAQISDRPESLLDAGSTLNHSFILNHPVLHTKNMHIMTLGPEDNCFWKRGISYLFGDLRDIPIRSGFYDCVACISVLEHIGCDNSAYVRVPECREDRPTDFTLVMRELSRVLKPGGTLLLTVPFGKYRHFGVLQQFDRRLLSSAIDNFGGYRSLAESFYRYTDTGWILTTAQDCVEGHHPPSLFSVHAVACIRLTK